MKSPLALAKEKFGDKKKLIEAVEKFTGEELWLGRTNKGKGLSHVSNAKLLRLHDTFSQVKEKFATRFKLVDAIVALEKRTKDEGFRTRLLAYPVPRLWDLYRSADKREKAAVARASAAPATPKPAQPAAASDVPKAVGKKPALAPAAKKAAPKK
jgi:hypothetical protein